MCNRLIFLNLSNIILFLLFLIVYNNNVIGIKLFFFRGYIRGIIMKRNPLIPFALIAALGIAVMLLISLKGAKQADEIANGDKKQTETASTKPDEIYAQTCVSCHGDQLQGAVGPALKKVGSKYSEDEIKNILQNGKEGGMPGGLVSGPQLEAVAKWLAEKK